VPVVLAGVQAAHPLGSAADAGPGRRLQIAVLPSPLFPAGLDRVGRAGRSKLGTAARIPPHAALNGERPW
jgi:hypothetical protein